MTSKHPSGDNASLIRRLRRNASISPLIEEAADTLAKADAQITDLRTIATYNREQAEAAEERARIAEGMADHATQACDDADERVRELEAEVKYESDRGDEWLENATYEVGGVPRLWKARAEAAEAKVLELQRRNTEIALRGIKKARKIWVEKDKTEFALEAAERALAEVRQRSSEEMCNLRKDIVAGHKELAKVREALRDLIEAIDSEVDMHRRSEALLSRFRRARAALEGKG